MLVYFLSDSKIAVGEDIDGALGLGTVGRKNEWIFIALFSFEKRLKEHTYSRDGRTPSKGAEPVSPLPFMDRGLGQVHVPGWPTHSEPWLAHGGYPIRIRCISKSLTLFPSKQFSKCQALDND